MRNVVDRRTHLKATGVALALPLLESMAVANDGASNSPPRRMVFICNTLGLYGPSLWPEKTGIDYESTEYLDLLQDYRSDMTLFSGLCHQHQSGRRPHDSEASWLTAARNPGFSGFRNSISVDQFAAQHIGHRTRLPSINLSSNNFVSQSYTRQGVMIPAQTSPAKLFAELFLQGTPDDIESQKRKLEEGRSTLDELGDQLSTMRKRISGSDGDLLDEYFDAVRQVEINIATTEGWMEKPKPQIDSPPPSDVKSQADLVGRVQALTDLIPLILQTDSSRIVTVMIQDHNVVPQIAGVDGNHHNLSHHGQDESKIAQLKTVESSLLNCLGSLLGRLKSTQEKEQTLLQQTSILFGSNLGNANMHNTRNLPLILAGGGYNHGGYVATEEDTPLCNLFLKILTASGMEAEAFGQSTGVLDWS